MAEEELDWDVASVSSFWPLAGDEDAANASGLVDTSYKMGV